tara:strand:- start:4896 stop:5255 length:360 start_codon:yes stop_codon:yes gene_type:complete
MRHTYKGNEWVDGYDTLTINEVYYEEDKPETWTKNPVNLSGDSIEELRDMLQDMLKALDKDILDYEPIGEMDSTGLIGPVRKRFEELTKDGNKPHLEWRSFYTGWLEGRVDMKNKLKQN